jgi:hypothetical protein
LIEIANGTAKLIKTGLQATADWAEAKAINGVTIATKLQTAANWALQASMGPVLAGLLLLTAALVAFVAIVMGVVAISTKFVEA